MDFEPFDVTRRDFTHEQIKEKKIDNLIGEVFLTPAGLKLLGYLEEITILRPSFKIGSDPNWGYFREGQNDIIRQLIEGLSRQRRQRQVLKKIRRAYNSLLGAMPDEIS